jgi:hypothetical protein
MNLEKSMNPQRYNVTLTEAQVSVISMACELVGRLRLGQFYDIVWKVYPETLGSGTVDHEKLRTLFDDISLELRKQRGHSGSDKDWTDAARAAWDIHQVFRHRLSWDNNPGGNNMNVHFDEPMPISQEPLPKIEGYTYAEKQEPESKIPSTTKSRTKRPESVAGTSAKEK